MEAFALQGCVHAVGWQFVTDYHPTTLDVLEKRRPELRNGGSLNSRKYLIFNKTDVNV